MVLRDRRLLLALLGALCLTGAAALAPQRSAAASADPVRRSDLLGPLRPILAELLLLQFEVDQQHAPEYRLLDHARRIVDLRPDRVDLWLYFTQHFILDRGQAPVHFERQIAWVRAGFRLLEDGLRALPRAPLLWLARGQCIQSLALHHPELLAGAGLQGTKSPWEAVLSSFETALDLAPEGVVRLLALEHLSRRALLLLEDSSLDARFRARTEAVGRRLVEAEELQPKARELLRRLLNGPRDS
jgi:hypothetical protein